MTWILNDPAAVAIGKRVRLKLQTASDAITLPMFELDPS
jgi:hypothetical protein